jgi:hypothetical protein
MACPVIRRRRRCVVNVIADEQPGKNGDGNSDGDNGGDNGFGERRDHLKHIRKILLAERKRLEDRRAESFRDISTALHKMAQDELTFVKTVVLRQKKPDEEENDEKDEDEDDTESD